MARVKQASRWALRWRELALVRKKVPTKVQGKRLGSEKVKKTRDRNRKKRYREQRYYNLRCPKSGTQQKRKAEQ
jgi:hypothetical protein